MYHTWTGDQISIKRNFLAKRSLTREWWILAWRSFHVTTKKPGNKRRLRVDALTYLILHQMVHYSWGRYQQRMKFLSIDAHLPGRRVCIWPVRSKLAVTIYTELKRTHLKKKNQSKQLAACLRLTLRRTFSRMSWSNLVLLSIWLLKRMSVSLINRLSQVWKL